MAGLITIEQLPDSDATYIIRGCKKYGDPYTMVCTAIAKGDTVVIKGMHGAFTSAMRRSMYDALYAMGYRKVVFERHRKNGEVTRHEVRARSKEQ